MTILHIIPDSVEVDLADVLSIGISKRRNADFDATLYYLNFKMLSGETLSKRYREEAKREERYKEVVKKFKSLYPARPVSHKE